MKIGAAAAELLRSMQNVRREIGGDSRIKSINRQNGTG